jgi:hypothetical protein
MAKTLEENFRDWEGNTFGFGYGSGEPHTIPALRRFLELCNQGPYGHSYDYQKLETELTPTVAWLLINILCKADILEYGTSPRGAWLTKKGERLKEYVISHTDDELVETATNYNEDYSPCYPNVCNCGEYEKGRVCVNPFW